MTTTDSRSLLEIAQQYAGPGLAVRARLESQPPGFLMHSAEAMQRSAEATAKHRGSGKRSKFIPEAAVEAEFGAYKLTDGSLYLPTKNLLRSLIEASKAFKKEKSRASLQKEAAAGISVPAAAGIGFPLLHPKTGEILRTYTVDIQRAVVQRSAIMRSRPLIEEWAVEVEFSLDPDAIPPEIFAQIIGYAGSRIGVGDQRPEKAGAYGRFTVTELEVA
jgi:hypothetical protein